METTILVIRRSQFGSCNVNYHFEKSAKTLEEAMRYKVALENNYTHISSIILGEKIAPKVWEYLQPELKKPLNEKLFVDKDTMRTCLGEVIWM